MKSVYKTRGVCSREIHLDIEDGIVKDAQIIGGCSGNTQGVAALVRGMEARKVVDLLRGIRCGAKPTSCPDQLAIAVSEAIWDCAAADEQAGKAKEF